MREFYVYLVTNLVNGKFYVGKTNKPKYRWQQHKKVAKGGPSQYPNEFSVVHKAIQKYGDTNFTFNILEAFETEDEAYYFETWWIEFLRSNISSVGYNLNVGGKGGMKPSPLTIAKKSLAALGKKHSDATKEKLSVLNIGSNNPNYGLKRSDTTLKKMSEKQKGENNPSAKITEQQVLEIRKDYESGAFSYKELSVKYNIEWDHVYRIIKRKVWKHI